MWSVRNIAIVDYFRNDIFPLIKNGMAQGRPHNIRNIIYKFMKNLIRLGNVYITRCLEIYFCGPNSDRNSIISPYFSCFSAILVRNGKR